MRSLIRPLAPTEFTPVVEEREPIAALAQFKTRFQVNRQGRVFGVSIGSLGNRSCLDWLPAFPELISFAVVEYQESNAWFGDAELASLRSICNLKAIAAINCSQLTANSLHLNRHQDQLRWLTLANCNIRDRGILRLSEMCKLLRLAIPDCPASDKSLKSLRKLRNLRQLNLQDTLASSSTIELLVKSLPKCRITLPDGKQCHRGHVAKQDPDEPG